VGRLRLRSGRELRGLLSNRFCEANKTDPDNGDNQDRYSESKPIRKAPPTQEAATTARQFYAERGGEAGLHVAFVAQGPWRGEGRVLGARPAFPYP
jgi:hypothetical protein